MKSLLAVLAVVGATLAMAVPATADPPNVRQLQDVFVDVNPCTGLEHTVTIDVTIYEHGASGHAVHTITTSSGFVGRGEETSVFHDAIFVLNDILVNPETGERIRAQLHILSVGAPSDEPRVFLSRVECLGAGRA